MTPPNGTEHRAIVDTHRHPIGPKLAAKMAERGFYDPKQEFPQANAQDLIGYREFYDLDYARLVNKRDPLGFMGWAPGTQGAVRGDFLVELRGLCAGRPARSNRCKSDAMKE
jgi:hypothetical protein